MKKFFILTAVIITFCVGGVAQKKAVVDPCLSKDPKVRAASKKPCPSAPSPNDKTDKKQTSPSKKTSDKNNENGGSTFFITIEHNGEKTELAYTQFENHDGNAMLENEKSDRMTFFYGAGNDRANDESFMFNGMIPTAAKGNYLLGTNGVMFGFMSTKFPNVPMFICQSGNYDIITMPLRGAFLEGNFTAQCTGEIRDDGSSEKYTLSGKFKLLRAM